MKRSPGKNICATCKHFKFKYRPGSHGQAYCEYLEMWFPGQFGWAHGDGTLPPGERTCENWKG